MSHSEILFWIYFGAGLASLVMFASLLTLLNLARRNRQAGSLPRQARPFDGRDLRYLPGDNLEADW